MHLKTITIGVMSFAAAWASGQTTKPTNDAAKLYAQAGKMLANDDVKNIQSPSASNMDYPGYPPMTDAWLRMEKQDYQAHAKVGELVHQAAMMSHAAWVPFNPNKLSDHALNTYYLNTVRNIANEIADAAMYQSLILKDQPAAFESMHDLMHLAELVKTQPGENLIRLLAGQGIEALDWNHLMIITSGVTITQNPSDTHDLPLSTAKKWIARLLNHPSAQAELNQALKGEPAGATNESVFDPSFARMYESLYRIQMGRDMAAMSLAAHVYRFEHKKWPANLKQLATELPRVPVDPFGNGTQKLGYMLIKGGLPDGKDRPLVYSRWESIQGLYYRIDAPQYGFYVRDGSGRPHAEQRTGGQFMDVARWAPSQHKDNGATTRPLP